MTQDKELEGLLPYNGDSADLNVRSRPNLLTFSLSVMTLILIGWALRAMALVMVPVVASLLIATAVMPLRDWVRDRLPSTLDWFGQVAAMALILLTLVLFFGGMWLAAQQILRELPAPPGLILERLQATPGEGGPASLTEAAITGAAEASADNAVASVQSAQRPADSDGLLSGTAGQIVRMLWDGTTGATSGVAVTILNSALAIAAGLALIFFLTLLILVESGDWRQKVQEVTRPRTERSLLEAADVISAKLQAYLLMRTVLSLVTATLYVAWLWYWGAGMILVWALLTFFLSFIPTLGSLIAGVLPVVYVLLTHDWSTALFVGAGILVIEQVMGNYAEPRLEGSHIALSPLVVLVALIFWIWVWGLAGALLAVPVTVSLMVLASHVPSLRPWAMLLTDRTTMSGFIEATRSD